MMKRSQLWKELEEEPSMQRSSQCQALRQGRLGRLEGIVAGVQPARRAEGGGRRRVQMRT